MAMVWGKRVAQSDVPLQPEYIKRLVECYKRATPEQLSEGRGWYPRWGAWCRDLAELSGLTFHQVAAIAALTSPQSRVSVNMASATSRLHVS